MSSSERDRTTANDHTNKETLMCMDIAWQSFLARLFSLAVSNFLNEKNAMFVYVILLYNNTLNINFVQAIDMQLNRKIMCHI